MAIYVKIGLLVISIILALVSTVWKLWDTYFNENIPHLIYPSDKLYFDYIIVGAGTAGSVLASFLCQNSSSTVLLIEAGHTFNIISKIPLMAPFVQLGGNDWMFLSTSQKSSSGGLHKRKQTLPRGKGLGGSSQLNFMLHFNGLRKDFENWKRLGIQNWDYENVLPLIDAKPECLDESLKTSKKNSKASNHRIKEQHEICDLWEVPKNYSKLTEAFEKARDEFKHQPVNFRRSLYDIKNGLRWGVYQKYLRPSFHKPNLKIMTYATVQKVNFVKKRAVSVTVRARTKNSAFEFFEIFVNKEIILSAGAYQTPQILLASGVGPQSSFENLGIKPVLYLPRIGENLHDHFNVPLFVSINTSASLNMDKILSFKEIFRYMRRGRGHFANCGILGHLDATNDTFGVTLFGNGAMDESTLMALSNYKTDAFRTLFPLYFNKSQEGFLVLSNCYQPISRGNVKIASKDLRIQPIINPNYLSSPNDIKCTIKGIRYAVKLVTSESFKFLHPLIYWPRFPECADFGPFDDDFKTNQPSDQYLECFMKMVGLGSHHPGGTCSMGANPTDSVVDSKLRVYGLNGLRIVDASVLPTPISGNPNGIIVAIAKRAADFILNVAQT